MLQVVLVSRWERAIRQMVYPQHLLVLLTKQVVILLLPWDVRAMQMVILVLQWEILQQRMLLIL